MSKPVVMLDLDGTIIDLHKPFVERVHKMGFNDFSMDRVLTYDFNKTLPESLAPAWLKESAKASVGSYYLNADRAMLFNEFDDVTLFEDADFFDGVVDAVVELSKYAKVVFHSFAFKPSIAQQKIDVINKTFTDVIPYGIITSVTDSKPILLNFDYVVEDNAHDLVGYNNFTQSKLVLIDKPYNSEEFNPSLSSLFLKAHRCENPIKSLEYVISECKNLR